MKHAGKEDFARLDGMLTMLRLLDGLKEKKEGVFYRKSRAFLHFHADGDNLYADLRLSGDGFVRHEVTGKVAQAKLYKQIEKALQDG